MKSIVQNNSDFPISKTKIINGTRRLVREKVMQILVAHSVSNVDTNFLFNHIFYRDFNIDDENEKKAEKKIITNNVPLITDEDILNLHSDASIRWQQSSIEFGNDLISAVKKNNDFLEKIIKEVSENWDYDRISIIDKVIIFIASVEFVCFPDIPVKATINEAVELAKIYSTDKSYIFINGILEKIKNLFAEKKLVNKSERGLR